MCYSLTKLNYKYEDLEPYLTKKSMIIHHMGHHQTYINNINTIIKQYNPNLFKINAEILLTQLHLIPKKIRYTFKNNLGGYINHNIYFNGLKKNTIINKNFKKIIENKYKSMNEFKKKFTKKALTTFGSSWIWLIKDINNKLHITTTSNQNNPIIPDLKHKYGYPIITLDLWEHAYYVDYYNKKIEFINNYWNLINWDIAYLRYRNNWLNKHNINYYL